MEQPCTAHLSPKPVRAFSLLELVVVVVVIAVIAAIAIPRMSRGAAGASDSALVADLAALRKAIDLFATEHGGSFPTKAAIVNQLTQYTDAAGNAQADKDATHIYGPYIRQIPPLPVGERKGSTGIDDNNGASVGWRYDDETTGHIRACTTSGENDATGKPYSEY